ncbi:hypothetical protein J4K35_004537 [Salmonella enterica]|nr:hypothetical protein [Salmonella enterica]
MNDNSGLVNTDSGKMNSDSGHSAKSWYFPPEYAFTQNQKQRSRSARMAVHVGPEYARLALDISVIVTHLPLSRFSNSKKLIVNQKHIIFMLCFFLT